jgi:hypothetical protein
VGHKFDFEISTLSRDDILQMNIDELQKKVSKLKRLIREAKMIGQDTTVYEIEYCYLDHERQMRLKAEEASKKLKYRQGENN